MGRKIAKDAAVEKSIARVTKEHTPLMKSLASERTLGMFTTRDNDAPGVLYVPFERGRVLLTTKPGNALMSEQVRGAIIRIAPEAQHSDDEIETLRNVLKEWGALRVIVLPKPRDKVLPEKGDKTTPAQARSLRQVVHGLVTDSAFDDKAALAEFVEEILCSEGL